MIRAALLWGLLGMASPAFADCDHFKWSVAKEREAFAGAQPLPSTGASADVGKGYDVALTPDLALPVKPERAPKAGTSAAVFELPKLDAGAYQVTLSAEAWIDVSQGGAVVKSIGFSGQKDCPEVRKSVRFPLGAGAATVEISNVQGASIKVAVEPAN
jgi:hypothetical protein